MSALILLKLLTFFKSRLGIEVLIISALLIAGYSWHRSVVRTAQQQAIADTREAVSKELEAEYKIEKTKLEMQITDLQATISNLSKQRITSQVIVQAAEQKQAETIKEIQKLNTSEELINDVCRRIKCAHE